MLGRSIMEWFPAPSQVGLIDMLYCKSLRISSASRSRLGVGSIVNLQSNDAAKLWNLPQYLHMLWSGPFQVSASCLIYQ